MTTLKRFRSKTTFRNWLRRNNCTKDASPRTGIYNSRGKRIGAAYAKTVRNTATYEVDLY